MKSFARATKLTNIGGRADYISNPDRQEQIVAKSAPVDWTDYQQFEQAKQKTLTDQRHTVDGKEVICKSRSIEGREIVMALPNEWAKLRPAELSRRADHLAHMVAGAGRDVQWAVHWNKAHTNLHLHVIFSERQRIAEPGRWDRDIYHTEDGKVARRKADRAKNPDGTDKPPVHRKGDLKDGFSAKDTRFKEKGWLHELKGQLREEMQQRWKVKFDERGLLHEYHEGKGSESPLIREKNEAIRATNRNYAEYLEVHPDITDFARKTFIETAKRERAAMTGRVTTIEWSPTMGSMVGTCSLEDWKAKEAQKAEEQAAETAKNAPQSVFGRIKGRISALPAKNAPQSVFGRIKDRISALPATRAEKAAQKATEAELAAARSAAYRQQLKKSLDEWMAVPDPSAARAAPEPTKTTKDAIQQSMEEYQEQIAAMRPAADVHRKDPERQKGRSKGQGEPER